MATKRFFKMRFLRMWAKWKNTFQFVFGIILLICLCIGVYHIGRWWTYTANYCYHAFILNDVHDVYCYSKDLGKGHCFYDNGSHSYIRNEYTRKKELKDINWIVGGDTDEDSLLCFASNGLRGYFNRNTGKVDLPAKYYRRAWLFSEGLAATMEEDSVLRFINPRGEIIIDTQLKCEVPPALRGYLFKNGYCPIQEAHGKWGMIDKNCNRVIPLKWDDITFTKHNFWICKKDGKLGLMNESLKLIVEPEYREVLVTDNGIEILMEDYTRQLLDFDGNILESFMYTDIRELYYKSGVIDPNADEYKYTLSPYKEYQTTYSLNSPVRVGLMGPDGIPVTPPLYNSIEAVSEDLFRCIYDESGIISEGEGASVLINKKGQVIR